MYARVTTIIVILVFSALGVQAAFWDVEPVYTGGMAGGDASLALDSASIPSVSYAAAGSLYVATKVLGGWDYQHVANVGWSGGWASLAFDSTNHPSVAFIDSSDPETNRLKFAVLSGGSWSIEDVCDLGWMPDHVSLAFDSVERACVAFARTEGEFPDLVTYVSFARRTGANSWTIEDIASIEDVTTPSLAVANGVYHVGFADPLSCQLKLATRSEVGGAWQVQVTDGSPSARVVSGVSLSLDGGSPSIVYFRLALDDVELRYARKIAGQWESEVVRTFPAGGPYHCSHAITSSGIPVIAHYDPEEEVFACSWKYGALWLDQTVDASSQSGHRPSLKIDGVGNMDAAYVDTRNGQVKFAWAVTPLPVGFAKSLPDASVVQISGAIASTDWGELGDCVYVQSPDRSAGIKVHLPEELPVVRGMVLDIQGEMSTLDGERTITDPYLVDVKALPQPRPLGMIVRNTGGSSAPGQQGVIGGTGLNNLGLLISVLGKVESVGSGYFMLDDGSPDQIKCLSQSTPALHSYVRVTGVSSCEPSMIRVLRVRPDGIQTFL